MTTPKQTLVSHLAQMHGWEVRQGGRWTYADLQLWHSRQHHRRYTNHYHEGVNLDAGRRPPGWRTGEGAVPLKPGITPRKEPTS